MTDMQQKHSVVPEIVGRSLFYTLTNYLLISMELSFRAQWFSVLFSAALVWCNMEYWNAIYRLTGKKLAAWVLRGVCIAEAQALRILRGVSKEHLFHLLHNKCAAAQHFRRNCRSCDKSIILL